MNLRLQKLFVYRPSSNVSYIQPIVALHVEEPGSSRPSEVHVMAYARRGVRFDGGGWGRTFCRRGALVALL